MTYLEQTLSPPTPKARSRGYELGETSRIAKSTDARIRLKEFVAPPRGGTIDPAKAVRIRRFNVSLHRL